MSNKPDEAKLMAYLYGELSEDEKREIDTLIEENPEIGEELAQLQGVQNILQNLPDKEVIEPVIPHPHQKKVSIPYLRTILAVAASISLIILLGYFTKLNINYGHGQLAITFGELQQVPERVEEVKGYEAAADHIKQEQNLMKMQIDSLRAQLAGYNTTNEIISNQIELALNKSLSDTKLQLDGYASDLREVNKEAVLSLFSQSEDQQRQYINTLLTEYNEYLEGRRRQDIEFYINGLRDLQQDTEQKQFETQQILANLITTNGQVLPGVNQAGSK